MIQWWFFEKAGSPLRVLEGSSSQALRELRTAREAPAQERPSRRARTRAAPSTPPIQTAQTRWEPSRSRRWPIQAIPDRSWTGSGAARAAQIRLQASRRKGSESQALRAAPRRRRGWPAMTLQERGAKIFRIAGQLRDTSLPPHRCAVPQGLQADCLPATRTAIASG